MEHFVNFKNVDKAYLENVIDTGLKIKQNQSAYREALKDKKLYMLFEKTSTRTALSFGLGMEELGGTYFIQNWCDSNFMVGEICDEIRYVGRNVDAVMARLKDVKSVEEMMKYSSVPVIDGCSNMFHPSQAMADMMTIKERFGNYNVKMLYVGVANNVLNSLAETLPILGGKLYALTPIINEPSIDEEVNKRALETGNFIQVDPNSSEEELRALVADMDVVYTDSWVDMEFFNDDSFKALKEERISKMIPFQLNANFLKGSKAIVMHDMPMHAGYEIDRETIEANIDVILQQAENRRHAEKGILYTLLADK